MGGATANPSIAEAVNLLEQVTPERLAAFRDSASPEARSALRGDIPLGEPAEAAPDLSVELAKVMVAALDEAIAKMGPALDISRAQLQRVDRWRLIGQIGTLLGGSAALGTALWGKASWQIIAAAFTLISAIATMLADRGVKLLGIRAGDATEAYEFLTSSIYPAKQLKAEISVRMQLGPDPELTARISEANGLCEKINLWINRIA